MRITFSKAREIKQRAAAHADKILPLLQAEIPLDLRISDEELRELLITTAYETEIAVDRLKKNFHAGD